MNKYLKIGLRIAISGSLIFFLIKTQDLEAIRVSLLNFQLLYLVIAVGLLIIGTYISSLRWQAILKTSNVHINKWYLFVLYLHGYFYNNFLPTQMGGDAYKSVSLGKEIKDQSTALFSVFMDRFGGLIILLLLALFGISTLYGGFGVLVSVIILLVGLILYFPILKIAAKKVRFLKKFESASFLFVKNKKLGALVLFYSLLVQLFSFFQIYLLFLGVNITLSVRDLLAFGPIVSLSSLVPSFNGFGTQETVYAYVFQNAGVTLALSITVSIMFHAVRLTMSLIGGFLMLIGFKPNIK